MQKLNLTGVGTAAVQSEIYDSTGTGMLPIQAHVTGVATLRIVGRVADDAPWVEIVAPGTAGFLQSFAWVPFLQLEITAGAGSVASGSGRSRMPFLRSPVALGSLLRTVARGSLLAAAPIGRAAAERLWRRVSLALTRRAGSAPFQGAFQPIPQARGSSARRPRRSMRRLAGRAITPCARL